MRTAGGTSCMWSMHEVKPCAKLVTGLKRKTKNDKQLCLRRLFWPPPAQAIGRDEAGVFDVFCISDLLSSGAAERQPAIAAISVEAEVPHAAPIRRCIPVQRLTDFTRVCDVFVRQRCCMKTRAS